MMFRFSAAKSSDHPFGSQINRIGSFFIPTRPLDVWSIGAVWSIIGAVWSIGACSVEVCRSWCGTVHVEFAPLSVRHRQEVIQWTVEMLKLM